MNINAHWIHERLVDNTVLDFARQALPDSVLAQWPNNSTPYPLAYEISDAVPSAYGDRAFHVRVALELMDGRKADAEISFTVEDPSVGDAYVHDLHAPREGYDDPTKTLEWNEAEGLSGRLPSSMAKSRRSSIEHPRQSTFARAPRPTCLAHAPHA